jgi:hypothetical protein
MRKPTRCLVSTCVTAILSTALLGGCDHTDSTTSTPPNTGTGLTGAKPGKELHGPPPGSETGSNPGGAPTFGKPTGMGFSTGDAAHSGGQGGGLMGYHNTGAAGTSGAITDARVDLRDDSRGVIVEPPTIVTTQPQ